MSGTDFFAGAAIVGNPNEVSGRYGPADYERPHTLVLTAFATLRWAVEGGLTYRAFSGRPYTVRYQTDVNGDGAANDRVYVPTTGELATMPLSVSAGAAASSAAQLLDDIIAGSACLRAARGRFITRNACRNPRQHVFDARIARWIAAGEGHRVQVVIDLFNILNGLDRDWGRRLEVSAADEVLLVPTAFDPATRRYRYRVNTSFGRATPTSFSLNQQFQVQLGLRYEF